MITLIIDEERAKILQYVLNSAFNDGILEFFAGRRTRFNASPRRIFRRVDRKSA